MHHYFEAITNTAGDSLIGYFARVIDRTTQNTVTLSSDDNGTPIVTVSGVENMAKSDAYGNLSLYVTPGTYHLDIYAPNTTSFLYRVSDVAMNSTKGDPGPPGEQGPDGEGLAEVMAPTGSTLVGYGARSVNSKLAERVSVKDTQFAGGAKGDNTTDDTAAFQAAVDYCIANRVGLFVPAGSYRVSAITATLTTDLLTSTLQIRGDGRRATRLIKIGSSTSPMLTIQPAPLVTGNVDIADLEMTGGGATADGIRLTRIASFALTRVHMNTFSNALDIRGSLKGIIEDCDLNGSAVGFKARVDTAISPNAVTIDNCRITGNYTFGMDFGDGALLRVVDSTIEENGTNGNNSTGGVILRSTIGLDTNYSNILFSGTHIENNFGVAFNIEALAAGRNSLIAFDTVAFIASTPGFALYTGVSPNQTIVMNSCYASSPSDVLTIQGGRMVLVGCTVGALAGARSHADVIVSTIIGTAPIEGNWQSLLHIGGAKGMRLSWANDSGGYTLTPNPVTGALELNGNGASRLDAGVIANFNEYRIGNTRVLTSRQAAIPDTTGAALAALETEVNKLKAMLRVHGLIS